MTTVRLTIAPTMPISGGVSVEMRMPKKPLNMKRGAAPPSTSVDIGCGRLTGWPQFGQPRDKGEDEAKRPADKVGNAVHVCRIAIGASEDDAPFEAQESKSRASARGHARAKALSAERRRDIAKQAASVRWRQSI